MTKEEIYKEVDSIVDTLIEVRTRLEKLSLHDEDIEKFLSHFEECIQEGPKDGIGIMDIAGSYEMSVDEEKGAYPFEPKKGIR